MDYNKIFIRNFKRIRRAKGLTQQNIADRLGVSKSLVYQWESGETRMAMEQLMAISEAYGIDVEQMRDVQDSKGNWYYHVPFLGKIQCGLPIFAQENIETYKMLPVNYRHKGEYFYLKARGDSMIEADIKEGDWLLMKKVNMLDKNDIGGFLFEDNSEVNLKIYIPDYDNDRIILRSANADYEDIIINGNDIKNLKIFAKLEQVERRAYTLEDIVENL